MHTEEVLVDLTKKDEIFQKEQKSEVRLQPDDCIKELIDDIRACVESP